MQSISVEVVARCSKCGADVVAKNSAVANFIRGGKSIICDNCRRSGRQWTKATYHEYLKSAHWQAMKQKALKRAGNKCQVCACTRSLDVHHNDYSRLGGELMTDLVVLCRGCHELFHGVMP